jgi:hypothetical protein
MRTAVSSCFCKTASFRTSAEIFFSGPESIRVSSSDMGSSPVIASFGGVWAVCVRLHSGTAWTRVQPRRRRLGNLEGPATY